jgi:hypothetical protein
MENYMNTIVNLSCLENLDEELMLIPVAGRNTSVRYGDQEPYFIFGGNDDDFDDEDYDDDFDYEDDFAIEDDGFDSDFEAD